MAISTQAKAFLASPLAQQVVNDIYSGNVVFSLAANRSILADNYKTRGIEIYNPHSAPFINHYRYVFLMRTNLSSHLDQFASTEIRNIPRIPQLLLAFVHFHDVFGQ